MLCRGAALQIAARLASRHPGRGQFSVIKRGAAFEWECGRREQSTPCRKRPSRNAAKAAVLLFATGLVLGACGSGPGVSLSRSEERTAIRLSAGDREHLLRGMRTYLASVQGIIEALPQNKHAIVAESARKGGLEMLSGVPASVAVSLPPGFLMLSMDTHQKFDALARSASAGDAKVQLLTQLGDILANCSACHAQYRLLPN